MRAVVLAVVAAMAPGVAGAQTVSACKNFVMLHAYASRAQFQCGFERYSNAAMEQAKSCSKGLGDSELTALLKAGMQSFDEDVAKKGKKSTCNAALRDFKDFVAR